VLLYTINHQVTVCDVILLRFWRNKMSKALTDLINDHQAILTALSIFTRMLDASKPDKLNVEEFTNFINFLKEFADKCHHGKEEGLLFPAMIAAGVPDRGGPIGVMMAEHIQGRGYIHTMSEALDEPVDKDRFERAGREYINLLRVHIQKENTVLFPMAERVISEAELETMAVAFEEHEERVIGHGRHAELHAMLDVLSEKYPG
jgi:hemerythrin-like domain-containing protein